MDKITDQVKLTAAILQTDPGAKYGKTYVQASNGMRISFTTAGNVEKIGGLPRMERDYHAELWGMPVTVVLRAEVDKDKRIVPEVRSASWGVESAHVDVVGHGMCELHVSQADVRELEKQLAREGEELVRDLLAQKPAWMEARRGEE